MTLETRAFHLGAERLDEAAAALFEEARQRARRRRRRRAVIAVGVVAAAGSAAATALLVRGHGRQPRSAKPAAVLFRPGHDVVYLRYDARWYSGGRIYQRASDELWYTATQERSIGRSVSLASARPVSYLEVVATAHTMRSYESRAQTLTTQTNCRARTGAFPHPWTADPVANFSALESAGQLRPRGRRTFDGRRVNRFVAIVDQNQLTYLVPPGSAEPIGMEVVPAATASLQNPGAFTGSVVRFLAHKREPLSASTRRLVAMSPHPAAQAIHLGNKYC